MKTFIASLLSAVVLALSSCSTPSGSSSSAPSTSLTALDPVITAGASLATSSVLTSITDATKKKAVANDIYAAAVGLMSLTGTTPTAAQVQSTLSSFTSSGEPEVATLINTFSGIYTSYINAAASSNGTVKTAAEILSDIASGAQSAASVYK